MRISVGTKLYFSVLSLFLLFAVSFIIFQQTREKQYKIDTLNLKLQDYNSRMAEFYSNTTDRSETVLNNYVRRHYMSRLRVTLIRPDGRVVYDSRLKQYSHISNHASRPEVAMALKHGSGSTVERSSKTFNSDYFYSATYFPHDSIVIRSALPYTSDLARSLQADQHYIWFAVITILLLTVVLYRFTSRLGDNIQKLRTFASRADHGESLDTEDLIVFPADELGEIAERIIKIYKRLQSTRREQDMLKRQLTQNIAHELKTPVASIQGYLETILENSNINDQMREQFLGRCYAQSQRLTSLLHDISTLNRMDDAPEMTSTDNVNISQMVQNIQKETALQLQQKHMTFDNRLPDNIVVRGNQSLLYSVFRNLTDNAIAYAGEGTTITLTAQRPDAGLVGSDISDEDDSAKWTFTFADNGVGVPAEHLPRLFERFYRVDKGRSRKMGGTGLGLAIVKNAVLLHGGTIRVSQNEGGGLKFEFTLKM
ncbi:MAG: ATP-binding protein [Prevotella sp.]|uniref:sensor histidine kinase n=1 Tax=Prevotella sp. TaxID=59823 RepID=UPI002600D48B|nr:ATP-binding protein [Prevotella sp.]MCI7182931.1 ATP-binding protein [Prevotella sp.]